MFDKYEYYGRGVQDPIEVTQFLAEIYGAATGRTAKRLGEDFSGTFALCREWVAADPKRSAVAVDIDDKPLAYGRKRLAPGAAVKVIKGDVRRRKLPEVDLVCALNFSYCTFQTRKLLKDYFAKTLARLPKKGMLVIDVLSGTEAMRALEDEVDYGDFKYFWEQASFDPILRRAVFHIHFQLPGQKRRERVFTYDWRLWTVPELRELLEEVGFRKTDVYWEGTETAWVAYIGALK